MEKKNTLLLTVIAVATLLVAVVGATFAYFSLSTTGGSNTTATISTPKIGQATITTKEPTLLLTLTAQDMDKSKAGTTYYASKDGITPGSATAIPIAQVTLSGAQDTAKYSCTTTVTVTADKSDSFDDVPNMLSSLKQGWAKLTLSGSVNKTIDIADLKETNTQTETGTYTLDVSTTGSVTQDILKAVLSFTNTADTELNNGDGNQNDVAGKTLKVKVEVKEGTCTLAADGE